MESPRLAQGQAQGYEDSPPEYPSAFPFAHGVTARSERDNRISRLWPTGAWTLAFSSARGTGSLSRHQFFGDSAGDSKASGNPLDQRNTQLSPALSPALPGGPQLRSRRYQSPRILKSGTEASTEPLVIAKLGKDDIKFLVDTEGEYSVLNTLEGKLSQDTVHVVWVTKEKIDEIPSEVENAVNPIVWASDIPGRSKWTEPMSIILKPGATLIREKYPLKLETHKGLASVIEKFLQPGLLVQLSMQAFTTNPIDERRAAVAKAAIMDGDWDAANALSCPVFIANSQAKWEPYDWKILQKAKETVTTYGLRSEAARNIIQASRTVGQRCVVPAWLGFNHGSAFFLMATAEQPPILKITWLTDNPVWVKQWPMTETRLQIAEQLIQEQLDAGHIWPSVSPWNTPIFVILKKSGITNDDLLPFLPWLRGSDANSSRVCTPEQQKALMQVSEKFQCGWSAHRVELLPLSLFLSNTEACPLATVFQWQKKKGENRCDQKFDSAAIVIEWVFLPVQPKCRVMSRTDAFAALIRKGRDRIVEIDGKEPADISIPMKDEDLEWLLRHSVALQEALLGFAGVVHNKQPKGPMWHLIMRHRWLERPLCLLKPVEGRTVFTDAG
ncbi:hypothetical protein HGM15179_020276 [Zosterops borbonicus]|uniref:Uncharacterized protein n=1 Tax=Zosterops borbonicus TaxID=364589 RepID=A0A8K1FYH7_9PASS|nr:hypothetical protein HGM15179_020276 [Zosterops borbonicus]